MSANQLRASIQNLTRTERVYAGQPAANAITEECERLGAQRVFLLVSSTLRKETDEIDKISNALGDKVAAIYDGIAPHVPRSDVIAAADAARWAECDLIVAVGGGSVIDAGKIVPVILKHNLSAHDDLDPYHVYVDDAGQTITPQFEGPEIPVICCPTTLSGGEFNTLSGATNETMGHKQGYDHPAMAAVSVVLDPALTRHTPDWLWFSTGVRAVDHALETLGSLESNYFSDGIADSALRLLVQALPAVKANPADLDARLRCQVGTWQSMLPIIGGVPMGASHAIGHILGGTANVPHGYCSCVMAPAVLAHNEPANLARQRRISACFGDTERAASEHVDCFITELGMPRSLSAVDVNEDQLDLIAEYAMLDLWIRTNPRPISEPADVMEILQKALN